MSYEQSYGGGAGGQAFWDAYPAPQQQGWPAGAYPQEGYGCDYQQPWPQAYYPPQGAQQGAWAWPQQAYSQPAAYGGYEAYGYQSGEAAAAAQPQAERESPVAPPMTANLKAKPARPKSKPKRAPKPRSKAAQALTEVVFWVFCVSLVAGSIFFAASNNPKKNYFGFRGYAVTTNSMAPKAGGSAPRGLGPAAGFFQGDMIFVRMAPASSVKVGDIITFNPNSRDETGTAYLTHRVVRVLDELGGEPGRWFVTQGDANPSEDPPITQGMYIGKVVFHVPKVGAAVTAVRKNFPLALAMLICFFLCVFLLRWFFTSPTQEEGVRRQVSGKRPPPNPRLLTPVS